MCRFFRTQQAERNMYRGAGVFFILLPLVILAWDRQVNNDKDTGVLIATLCWFFFSTVTFGLGYKIRDMLPENEASFLPNNRM